MTTYQVFRFYYRLRRQHKTPIQAAWIALKEALKPVPF